MHTSPGPQLGGRMHDAATFTIPGGCSESILSLPTSLAAILRDVVDTLVVPEWATRLFLERYPDHAAFRGSSPSAAADGPRLRMLHRHRAYELESTDVDGRS